MSTTRLEERQAAGLLLAGIVGAALLMSHHPTSLRGPDDGRLLADWSNSAVHGGMVLCLLLILLGGSVIPRWLGEARLSVRAGRLAFTGGLIALIISGLVNGFAMERLIGRPEAAIQLPVLGALNQSAAMFGVVMVAAAMALWGLSMIRREAILKVASVIGFAAAVLAAGWLVHGEGRFGLIPAVVATGVFAAWSALIAAGLGAGTKKDAQ